MQEHAGRGKGETFILKDRVVKKVCTEEQSIMLHMHTLLVSWHTYTATSVVILRHTSNRDTKAGEEVTRTHILEDSVVMQVCTRGSRSSSLKLKRSAICSRFSMATLQAFS